MDHLLKAFWSIVILAPMFLSQGWASEVDSTDSLKEQHAEIKSKASKIAGDVEIESKTRIDALQDTEAGRLIEQHIEIRDRAEAIVEDSGALVEQATILNREYLKIARELSGDGRKRIDEEVAAIAGSDPDIARILKADAEKEASGSSEIKARYRIFVSYGMGESALQSAMQLSQNDPSVLLVFRGPKRGVELRDFIIGLGMLAAVQTNNQVPSIVIDPTAFLDRNITQVPVTEKLGNDGSVVAWANGLAKPEWLDQEVNSGKSGFVGDLGGMAEITEPDMMVQMQTQLSESNLREHQERMVSEMWKNQFFVELPRATRDRTRAVDPTVVITEAITAPDGTIIAYPGERLNPFDAIPFDMTLVVIDATDPKQIEFARREIEKRDGKQVTVITTVFDREDGWKSYNAAIVGVGRVVYLLQPDIAERFQLEFVPSIVEGGDRVLLVHEYGSGI